MNITYEKSYKGHDIYFNGQWTMWVTGSMRNAKKEAELHLKRNYESAI